VNEKNQAFWMHKLCTAMTATCVQQCRMSRSVWMQLGVINLGNCTCVKSTFLCNHIHIHFMAIWTVWDYSHELVPEPIWILLKQETVGGSGIS